MQTARKQPQVCELRGRVIVNDKCAAAVFGLYDRHIIADADERTADAWCARVPPGTLRMGALRFKS